MATVAGIVADWALLADGWRREALRNDYLIELLAIGKARSPTFDRLIERARQTEPDRGGRPIDEAEAAQALTETTSEESAKLPPEIRDPQSG